MAKYRNLILVGFMGTGKTVVGKALAAGLNFSYLDTDDLIEQRAGKTIARIFAEDGESYFRDLETEALRSLVGIERHVVATGGGCVLRDENWKALREAGLVVCLTARPEVIFERTRRETHRPLLQTADPLARIYELLDRRAAFYARADYTVDTSDRTPADVAQHVQSLWQAANAGM